MDYPISVPSIGLVDGKFIDEDSMLGTPGSLIPSAWGNAVTDELLNVISAAGLAPSEVNNSQLLLAIRTLILGAQNKVLIDSGSAGAYAAANAIPLTAQPLTGYLQQVNIANPNPGPATYSPDGIAARPIYGLGLQPLQGGELPTGVAVFMYLVQGNVNAGNGAWILVDSLGGARQVAPATKSQQAIQFGQVSGVVGQARRLKMSVAAASATAALTADEIIVETALGGLRYCLTSFNKTINLATTGVGGMDTGLAPVSGFVAIYAIYNPANGASALLATNATSVEAPEVYGGANMPAGYTASALLSVWGTNSSRLLNIGLQSERRIETLFIGLLDINSDTATMVSVNISTYVPINAKTLSGQLVCGNNNAGGASVAMNVAGSAAGIGGRYFNAFVLANGTSQTPFFDMPILTPQTMFTIRTTGAGPARYQVIGASYTF
ncbi:hypothetical protein I4N56_005695 [Pseudomonas mohnii]|uniref:hypothetical protein n=1 Tax=Pseudomonas mohnii TaxID=395600 RepID=UPI0018DD4DB7|nr:hypothetical protein [Pseudomonas mohnii]MBH8610486.1 hypothetical protein [Pseudomonas mohnii]